jgi:hypothetical protein
MGPILNSRRQSRCSRLRPEAHMLAAGVTATMKLNRLLAETQGGS